MSQLRPLQTGEVRDGSRPFFYNIEDIPAVSSEEYAERLDPSVDRDVFFETFGHKLYTKGILRAPDLTVVHSTVAPGESVKPHKHGTHQITYVLRGSLRYGHQEVGPGMGFFSPNRPYSWTAGPDGAEWLEIHTGPPQILL